MPMITDQTAQPRASGAAILRRHAESGCAGRIVSRDEAWSIAAAAAEQDGRGWHVGDVVDISELEGRSPRVAGVSPAALDRAWIGYLEIPHGRFALRSGEVVVVSKAGGEILYTGAADDEG